MTQKILSFDSNKLIEISNRLCDNYDLLLEKLNVSLEDSGKYFVGCCPIHCGDNKTALNLFKEGHTIRGNWVCRTRQCEHCFKPTILGFIRGVLSTKNGWCDPSDKNKIVSFTNVINWSCEFLQKSWDSFRTENKGEVSKFISVNDKIYRKRVVSEGVSREQALKCLQIPAPYFLKRGFNEELLRSYDIGLCLKSNHGFLERSIIPVYDEFGKGIVAYTGRSIHGQCGKCASYHNPLRNCPPENIRFAYSKWKHSPNINNYLFDYHRAKNEIKKSNTVILTEGPLDSIKLQMAGFKNAVAIFGTSLSEQQTLALELSGAYKLILMLDNDEPGREGCEKIRKQLGKSYSIMIPSYEGKDVGDLTVEQIQAIGGLK